ncbi:hypothetical protein D6833_12175, partial [Candidatus Parcubacteria bacterium]
MKWAEIKERIDKVLGGIPYGPESATLRDLLCAAHLDPTLRDVADERLRREHRYACPIWSDKPGEPSMLIDEKINVYCCCNSMMRWTLQGYVCECK